MLPANEDKKMLIESMKKLTHHISNNNIRQKEIFESLSKNDLLKIISNLSDENEYLRRISSLLLTELFYGNDELKQKFSQLLEINPSQGRICLNPIPTAIQKYPSTLKKCIQLMKSPLKQDESEKFCWTINLDRKILQIQFLEYKKYSSFTFLDPNRNIFGFTYLSQDKKHNLIQNSATKQQVQRSVNSRRSQKKESISLGNSFYKNFIQLRNRKAQSPSSYRQFYGKKQYGRPNTSRNQKDMNISSNQKSGGKNMNTIHSISHQNKTNKDLYSYNKVNTPLKNREKYFKSQVNSLHQSIQFDTYVGSSTLRTPGGGGTKEPYRGYRAPKTDRKNESPNNFYPATDRYQNISTGQKLSYPQTTKNGYHNQHEKFYKRVKEILKR